MGVVIEAATRGIGASTVETTGDVGLAATTWDQSARVARSRAKRLADLVLASLGLIVLAPLVAILALAIVIDSGFPVFYGQKRITIDRRRGARRNLGERTFTCWKLRTMVTRAEDRLRADERLSLEFARRFKLARDPRITRVGRILRKTSIDEVPQLWNVLRGEMSIVGPRPVIKEELRVMYGPVGELVFSVRPGLTGLWQISGRSTLDYARRVELDLEYVTRQSVGLDVSIMLRTPAAVVRMRGAI